MADRVAARHTAASGTAALRFVLTCIVAPCCDMNLVMGSTRLPSGARGVLPCIVDDMDLVLVMKSTSVLHGSTMRPVVGGTQKQREYARGRGLGERRWEAEPHERACI